jgi:(E)-4-hydroxy-3-methylbut-2-enyl-diphosphate synthase
MVQRRKTITVSIGSVRIGQRFPIAVQSMTKVPTTDIEGCISQIKKLVRAGCDLVRIALPTRADSAAFAKIVQKVDVPLIADVHFSPASD